MMDGIQLTLALVGCVLLYLGLPIGVNFSKLSLPLSTLPMWEWEVLQMLERA